MSIAKSIHVSVLLSVTILKCISVVESAAPCGPNCSLMWECQRLSGYPNDQEPIGAKHYPVKPSYAYLWTNLNFSVVGRIKRFSFYASSTGDIVVAVWRNASMFSVAEIAEHTSSKSLSHEYEMEIVGKLSVSCDTVCLQAGNNTIELEEMDRAWVKPGDYFGTIPSAHVFRFLKEGASDKQVWEFQDELPVEAVLTYDDNIPIGKAIPYGRANSVTFANTPIGSKHKFLFASKSNEESDIALPSVAITVECWCPETCEGVCDMYTGDCAQCKSGWFGFQCKLQCLPYTWGKNCKESCSTNCKNNVCDPVYGICLEGCHPGYAGLHCMKHCSEIVPEGYYLHDGMEGTETICGQCLNLKPCHCDTGVCLNGCAPGYKPPTCKQLCDPGNFGINCQLLCGNCDKEDNCRPNDGYCTNGCKKGWIGGHCTVSDKCDVSLK